MIKLSIIVPVYNLENYVANLLQSLSDISKNTDFEVILIDNASTDKTVEVIEKFFSESDYPNKLLKLSSNVGMSEARNIGIKQAKNEWVHFIDGDDYLNAKEYQSLLLELSNHEESVDAVMFGYQSVDESGAVIPTGISTKYTQKMVRGDEIVSKIVQGQLSNYVWSFIFRKKIWLDHDIDFPAGLTFEDIATVYKFFQKANKVLLSEKIVLNYVQRSDSITHVPTKKQVFDLNVVIGQISKDDSLSFDMKTTWISVLRMVQYQLLILINELKLYRNDGVFDKEKLEIIKLIKSRNISGLSGILKLKFILSKIGLYRFVYPIIVKRRR